MKRPSDLVPRLGVAALGIPLVFGALYLGGWVLGWVVAAVAAIGAWEFYGLARHQGAMPFRVLGAAASGAVVLAATSDPRFGPLALATAAVLLVLTAASLALSLFLRWPGGSPTAAFSTTVGGVLYVGVPMAFVPLLRALPEGITGLGSMGFWVPMAYVLLPLLATWASDTAAYFVGNAVGRVKLAPAVSPGKSVEGAVGGVVGGTAAGALVTSWWLAGLPEHALPVVAGAVVGAAVSVAGQIGDLVESALKREAGVKDSGRLLPGHGGFLDRVDALLWALPLTWALLHPMGVL